MSIVVAHGEGYADFSSDITPASGHESSLKLRFGNAKKLKAAQPLVTLRYVDNTGKPTETYPLNPNGSPQGITGFTHHTGRSFFDHDAAPRARVPRRAEFLVSARVAGERRMAEDVPECAEVGGVVVSS